MLSSLIIKNYRNIPKFDAELTQGGNLIVAPNGSGKTNILESIYYSVIGSSFKPMESNAELIGQELEFAKVSSKWDNDILEVTISNTDKVNRNFQLNTKKASIAKITSKFPVILFAPHSVDLVIGEPALRRNDLNAFLSILIPDYKKMIMNYAIVLRNRNAVIKQIQEHRSPDTLLDFWTEKLVDVGSQIYQVREDFFSTIKTFFLEAQEILFNTEHFTLGITYAPNVSSIDGDYRNTLMNKYLANRQKEIIVGKTLYGVHKDDFFIELNDQNLKFKGSRGQQRIGISVFKFAELLLYFKNFGVYPLLLLDDIMSELDDKNRQKIANYLLEKKLQFILTSAESKEIPEELKLYCNSILLID